MPIELTPSPPVMHLARWIETLVQQGESLEKITQAIAIVTEQEPPAPPETPRTLGRRLPADQDQGQDGQ